MICRTNEKYPLIVPSVSIRINLTSTVGRCLPKRASMSKRSSDSLWKVRSTLTLEIYDLNMKIRGSQMPIEYDDESYYGSLADGSVVVHEVAPRMAKGTTKENGKAESKPLPAIDEV